MGFGAFFEDAWDNATESAKSSFDNFAKTVKDKSKQASDTVGKKLEDIQETAQQVYDKSAELVDQFADSAGHKFEKIQKTAQDAYDKSKEIIDKVADVADDTTKDIQQAAKETFEQSKAIINKLALTASDKVDDLKSDAVLLYQKSIKTYNSAKDAVESTIGKVKNILQSDTVGQKLEVIETIGKELYQKSSQFVEKLTSSAGNTIDDLQDTAKKAYEKGKLMASKAAEAVKDAVGNIKQQIKDIEQAARLAYEQGKAVFAKLTGAFRNKANDVTNDAKILYEKAKAAYEKAKAAVKSKIAQIKKFLQSDAVEQGLETVKSLAKDIYGKGSELVNQLMSSASETFDKLKNTAQAVYQKSKEMVAKVTEIARNAVGKVKQTIGNIKNKAKELYDKSKDFVKNLASAIKDKAKEKFNQLKDTAKAIYDKGKQIYEKTKTAIKEKIAQAKEAAKNIYNKGKTIAKKALKKIGQTIDNAKNAVKNFFSPKPAGSKIEFCENKTKAERIEYRNQTMDDAKQRLEQMEDGKQKDALQKSLDRFKFNNKAVERARLAANTYEVGQNEPPEGWSRPDAEEIKAIGLDPKHFPALHAGFDPSEHKEGYFVEVYKSKPDVFGEEKYVIAFRGTQGGADWEANYRQATGKPSEHYTKARELAISIVNTAQERLGDQLEITGHSLGGGLATTVGIITGAKTYAYNPAGVHPATLKRAGAFSRDMANDITASGQTLVDNVIVEGEILDTLQNKTLQQGIVGFGAMKAPVLTSIAGMSLSPEAMLGQGTLTYDSPGSNHYVNYTTNAAEVANATAQGKSIQAIAPSTVGDINPLNKIDKHGMDAVIAGIEQQKADDMGQLTATI